MMIGWQSQDPTKASKAQCLQCRHTVVCMRTLVANNYPENLFSLEY